jgi:hypothetical protein
MPDSREGIDNDSINTEASNSELSKKSMVRTHSGCQVKLPSKYDGFKMTTAEIRLMQAELIIDTASGV